MRFKHILLGLITLITRVHTVSPVISRPTTQKFPASNHGAAFAKIGTVSFNSPLQVQVLLELTDFAHDLGFQNSFIQRILAQTRSKIGSLPEFTQSGLIAELKGIDRILNSLKRDKHQLENVARGRLVDRKQKIRTCKNAWSSNDPNAVTTFGPAIQSGNVYINGTAHARNSIHFEMSAAIEFITELQMGIDIFVNSTDLSRDPELQTGNNWISLLTQAKQKLLITQNTVSQTSQFIMDILSPNTGPDVRALPRIQNLLKQSSQLVLNSNFSLLDGAAQSQIVTPNGPLPVCNTARGIQISFDLDLPYSNTEFELFAVVELPIFIGEDLALLVKHDATSSTNYLAVGADGTSFVSLRHSQLESCNKINDIFQCTPLQTKLAATQADCNVARFLNDRVRADHKCHKAIVSSSQIRTAFQFPKQQLTILFAGRNNTIIFHCDDNCSAPLTLSIDQYAEISTACRLVLDNYIRNMFVHSILRDEFGHLIVEPVQDGAFFFFTEQTLTETISRVKYTKRNLADLAFPLKMTQLLPRVFERQHCSWTCEWNITFETIAAQWGIRIGILYLIGIILVCLLVTPLVFIVRHLYVVRRINNTASTDALRLGPPLNEYGAPRPIFPYSDTEREPFEDCDRSVSCSATAGSEIDEFTMHTVYSQRTFDSGYHFSQQDGYSTVPLPCSRERHAPLINQNNETTSQSHRSLRQDIEYLPMRALKAATMTDPRTNSPPLIHTKRIISLNSRTNEQNQSMPKRNYISAFDITDTEPHYATITRARSNLLLERPEYINTINN